MLNYTHAHAHTQTDACACCHARKYTEEHSLNQTHQSELQNETNISHYVFNLMVINSIETSIYQDEYNRHGPQGRFFWHTGKWPLEYPGVNEFKSH